MCAPTAGRGCWRNGRSKSEHDNSHSKLPAEVMAATACSALDKALDSTLNAVPQVPCLLLLLGLGVDQRPPEAFSRKMRSQPAACSAAT